MNEFFRTWGLLIIAVVIGVIAFFVATAYLSNRESSLRDAILGGVGEKRAVVVATVDIPVGTPVGPSNMAVAEVPVDHLSSAAITPDQFESYDGAILKVPLSPGEPLLDHSVEGLLIDRFSDLIAEGQRAVTIEVNTLTSNAGLLSVGDYVDIFLSGSFEAGESPGEDTFTPLFQRIKILAVDRYPLLTKQQPYRAQSLIDEEESELEYSSVTLRLEVGDADRLAYAASIGDIVFLLRNANDESQEGFDVLNTKKLLSGQGGGGGTYVFRSQSGTTNRAISNVSSIPYKGSESIAALNRVSQRSIRIFSPVRSAAPEAESIDDELPSDKAPDDAVNAPTEDTIEQKVEQQEPTSATQG